MARSAVGPTRSVCGRRYLKSALPRPSIGHGFELLHASHRIRSAALDSLLVRCECDACPHADASATGARANLALLFARRSREGAGAPSLVRQAFSATVSALQLQRQAGSAGGCEEEEKGSRRQERTHATTGAVRC
jgi:hypothetical protein